jgi:SAM-dependent methyltransferase
LRVTLFVAGTVLMDPITSDEACVRVSYFQLYCDLLSEGETMGVGHDRQQPQQQQQEQVQQQDSTDNNRTCSDCADPSSFVALPPWIEVDVWTEHDVETAERIVQGSLERCRIANGTNYNAATQRTGGGGSSSSSNKNDDDSNENARLWDQFYKQHRTNFFKDRHYLQVVFPKEFGRPDAEAAAATFSAGWSSSSSSPPRRRRRRTLVEVGCGVGNTLLPLLEGGGDGGGGDDERGSNGGNWDAVYGLDFSSVAIDMLRRDRRFVAGGGRCHAHVCDLSKPESVPPSAVGVGTVTSMLFCLSAIDPVHHATAVQNAASTMAEGGVLVFRDYGRYDEAQLKLARQRHKLLEDNFYRKHDGTKCYYFTVDEIRALFTNAGGLELLECDYIRRVSKNGATGEVRRRVWLQGRFRKTAQK